MKREIVFPAKTSSIYNYNSSPKWRVQLFFFICEVSLTLWLSSHTIQQLCKTSQYIFLTLIPVRESLCSVSFSGFVSPGVLCPHNKPAGCSLGLLTQRHPRPSCHRAGNPFKSFLCQSPCFWLLCVLYLSVYSHVGRLFVAQMVKNLPAMWETQVQSLIREDPPEKRMATPLRYSGLENSMDRGACWAIAHVVAES